jgi:K+-sensing histidine kinase KdpD
METLPIEREAFPRNVFNNVSHDFNTPLACIIGSLEILSQMSESLSVEQHNALIQTALTEVYKLNLSIAEMLEKLRPE